jgi:hypothetical protein
MSRANTALLALAGVATFAVGALAAETWDLKDRMAFFVNPTGQGRIIELNDTGHSTIMKEGRQLDAGTLIYRNGGKLYLMQDKKMASGKMMFATMNDWLARPF